MRSCGSHGVAPIEVTVVLPNAMHDDREFARHRHLGAAHADPTGEREPPGLKLRRARVATEQDVCRLEQVGAQQPVTALRDAACLIDLAGLVASWDQAQIRADRGRSFEAAAPSSGAASAPQNPAPSVKPSARMPLPPRG